MASITMLDRAALLQLTVLLILSCSPSWAQPGGTQLTILVPSSSVFQTVQTVTMSSSPAVVVTQTQAIPPTTSETQPQPTSPVVPMASSVVPVASSPVSVMPSPVASSVPATPSAGIGTVRPTPVQSEATNLTTGTREPTPGQASGQDDDSLTDTLILVGPIVGGVLLLIIIIVGVLMCRRARRRKLFSPSARQERGSLTAAEECYNDKFGAPGSSYPLYGPSYPDPLRCDDEKGDMEEEGPSSSFKHRTLEGQGPHMFLNPSFETKTPLDD